MYIATSGGLRVYTAAAMLLRATGGDLHQGWTHERCAWRAVGLLMCRADISTRNVSRVATRYRFRRRPLWSELALMALGMVPLAILAEAIALGAGAVILRALGVAIAPEAVHTAFHSPASLALAYVLTVGAFVIHVRRRG